MSDHPQPQHAQSHDQLVASSAHNNNNNSNSNNTVVDTSNGPGNAVAWKAPGAAAAGSSAMAVPKSHVPSLAGSVIETSDGLGGTTLIRIQNMSATANLGVRLDLKQIALRCRNTEFNPRRFGAVIMRLREPRATALIFASGKMCVTGTKSTHNSTLAAKKFAYIIERVGFSCQKFIDFKVQNIVGTADVGFPIRLEGLVYAHSTFASYEPELFPGLIYRLVRPRVVFLIFVSGKIVITGAKTEMDLSEALTKLYPVLVEYRKQNTTRIPGVALAIHGKQPAIANTANTPPTATPAATATASSGTSSAATDANTTNKSREMAEV